MQFSFEEWGISLLLANALRQTFQRNNAHGLFNCPWQLPNHVEQGTCILGMFYRHSETVRLLFLRARHASELPTYWLQLRQISCKFFF